IKLGRIQGDVVEYDDDLRVGGLARIEPEIARPASDQSANVAVSLVVGLNRGGDGLGYLLAAQRNFQLDATSAVIKPIDVLAQPKHLSLIHTDAFEDAVAVKQTVIENADLGVRFVVELAVDVDLRHRDITRLC